MGYRIYRTQNHRKKSWFDNLSITTWLIMINILLFVVFSIMLSFGIDINHIALNSNSFFEQYTFWTLLTSMFMHGGFLHLFVNMFVLFSLGSLCERIIGKKRFLWFYLISGIIAGLLHVFLSYYFGVNLLGARIFGDPSIPAVGASGAIFAIAGLFMILTPKLRFMLIFLPFFSLPAYIMIPLVLFVTWIVSASAGFLVGNVAHFGGFLAGVFYGLYLKNKYPRKTRMVSKYFSH